MKKRTNIQCAVCKKNGAVVLEDKALRLNRCDACHHAFKDMPKERQEKYDEDYFKEAHKNWFNNPDYPLFEFIRNSILDIKGRGPLKVLDVGCGKGDFLKYLKTRNPELSLCGIDLVDNNYPGITFFKGDILENDPGLKFDVICNLAVIEHIDSPHLFINKIKGLLTSGGIVFTVTDNDDGMIYSAARVLKRFGIAAPYDRLYTTHHMQCFSNKSLKLLLEMNGLSTIIHKRHNHPVAAVDYPKSGIFTMAVYKTAIWLIFMAASLCDSGILQINVSKIKSDGGILGS